MRKICFSLVVLSIILLMVSASFANPPRQPTSSSGKTGFTNIAVRGLGLDGTHAISYPGTPGYIEMTSTKGDVYYLYIGYDGDLRLASAETIGIFASPAIVGWSDASGTVVGTQD